jgi:hypothetical protein
MKPTWEEQFDSKFLETCLQDAIELYGEEYVVKELKDFIRQLLSEEYKKWCGKRLYNCDRDKISLIECENCKKIRTSLLKELEEGFIKEFCNDHNGEIRWLRGVALDEVDLLSEILKYFNKLKSV